MLDLIQGLLDVNAIEANTADDQAQLFQTDARLSARPTRGESSVGLGLSIVKKLTESMGGEVWAESEPGEGTTFCVRLPHG